MRWVRRFGSTFKLSKTAPQCLGAKYHAACRFCEKKQRKWLCQSNFKAKFASIFGSNLRGSKLENFERESKIIPFNFEGCATRNWPWRLGRQKECSHRNFQPWILHCTTFRRGKRTVYSWSAICRKLVSLANSCQRVSYCLNFWANVWSEANNE